VISASSGSATVDPYIMDLSICFADVSSVVRRQSASSSLLRLISEDFCEIATSSSLPFPFSASLDKNADVASFAQSFACF
jgi:hypothetical protein